MLGIIALNLKAYIESTGEAALSLVEAADAAAKDYPKAEVIVCVQAPELRWVCGKGFKFAKVFAQHADFEAQGAHTGAVVLEALVDAGAAGTLVNHAEKKVSLTHAEKTIARANSFGLRTIACAKDVLEGEALAEFKPTAVAVEPPELIGSGVSVSKAKPRVIEDAVKQIKHANPCVQVLVGAGVSNAADVGKCFELGAEGVLLASAFVKAKNPEDRMRKALDAVP